MLGIPSSVPVIGLTRTLPDDRIGGAYGVGLEADGGLGCVWNDYDKGNSVWTAAAGKRRFGFVVGVRSWRAVRLGGRVIMI